VKSGKSITFKAHLGNFSALAKSKVTNKKAPRLALCGAKDRLDVGRIQVLGHVHGDENHQEHQNATGHGQHDRHHGHDGFDNVLFFAVFWCVVGHEMLPLKI
jgi:hypothetical protein